MGDVLHVQGPVLTGRDEEVDGLWVVDGRISLGAPGPGHDVTTLRGWVLPGLVDAHCHVGLDAHGAVDAATSEAQATTDRDAGTLLIRDAGSPADTRWIDDRDDLPKIVRAGRHIARTRRYIRNYAHEIEPDELPAYMAQEARAGDGWVKIVGDWIDRTAGDLAPCWPLDALQAGIAAAHAEGARVTAHCFGEDCLADLLAAGIDGIEHGTGFRGADVDAAAAAGVAVVPTLVNIATFPQLAEPARGKFDAWADHMLALHAHRYETVVALHEAGVPVYVGTDAGGSLPHGLVAAEVAELVTAGLAPIDALDAACWAARSWLGRPALEEGADADLVVYAADPREDVGVLAHPQHVVLRGRAV
ncbi:amidohydrolase family protein [Angustibacter speluncae]